MEVCRLSKSVLISIRPQWCELIANGKKTIEVRKTRPKLETPFKCYIYCTVGGDALCPPHMNSPKWDIHRQGNGTAKGRKMTARERDKSDYRFANGKVIGEFVCDSLIELRYNENGYGIDGESGLIARSCIPEKELYHYLQGKNPFSWHISALQIYDNPKELSEFTPMCRYREDDGCCQHKKVACGFQEADYNQDGSLNLVECGRKVTRPPQSWCYVEDIDAK